MAIPLRVVQKFRMDGEEKVWTTYTLEVLTTEGQFVPAVAKFVTNEFFGLLARHGWTMAEVVEYREDMAGAIGDIVEMRVAGLITSTQAKEILEAVWAVPYLDVLGYAVRAGMLRARPPGELEGVVARVIEAHEDVARQVASGKVKAVEFIVGQVMKAVKGRADAGEVREMALRQIQGA